MDCGVVRLFSVTQPLIKSMLAAPKTARPFSSINLLLALDILLII